MEQKKDYEVNLSFIFQSLLHHWYVILIAVILAAAGTLSFAKFMVTPKYESTIKMYVNNDSAAEYVSTSELLVAQELVNTYLAILETPDTMNMVIEAADLDCDAKSLSRMITSGSINETEIFFVTVTSTDPDEAVKIANTICKVFPQRISNIVEKSSVSVVQTATVPTAPASPKMLYYGVFGVLLGIVLSCLIIMIKEFADNSIRNENYPSETYSVRTLARIPNLYERLDKKKGDGNRKVKVPYAEERSILCENLPFGAAESYKMLRANLQNLSEQERSYQVIGITSPNPSEGKSTLATNYAYTLAQTGARVILIEADMRKPVLAKRLALANRLGLSDMLMDEGRDAIQDSGRLSNWKVICAGTAIDNPSELLGSRSMDLMVERLREHFDYVIVDLPPVNEVSDAITISRFLDGIICAIKKGSTTKMNLETAMHHMTYSKTELVGFVITNSEIGRKYGGKHGKGYYYTGNN